MLISLNALSLSYAAIHSFGHRDVSSHWLVSFSLCQLTAVVCTACLVKLSSKITTDVPEGTSHLSSVLLLLSRVSPHLRTLLFWVHLLPTVVLHEERDLWEECLAEKIHLFTVLLLPEGKVICSNMALKKEEVEILKQVWLMERRCEVYYDQLLRCRNTLSAWSRPGFPNTCIHI